MPSGNVLWTTTLLISPSEVDDYIHRDDGQKADVYRTVR